MDYLDIGIRVTGADSGRPARVFNPGMVAAVILCFLFFRRISRGVRRVAPRTIGDTAARLKTSPASLSSQT